MKLTSHINNSHAICIICIFQDCTDTAELLARDNVDQDCLANYAREAADFSTNSMLPHLDFAVNHYGQADLAMFDFTSLFQAENASRVIERMGRKLLMILVGDSLLEVIICILLLVCVVDHLPLITYFSGFESYINFVRGF